MTEAVVAMPGEGEPWAATSAVKAPVAAPRVHLHAVVDAFRAPAGLPTLEVVRARLQPLRERPQNALALGQLTLRHPRAPAPARALGSRLRVVAFAQLRQGFPPVVGGPARRRVPEEPLEPCPLRRFGLPRRLARRPPRPCDLGVRGLGPGALEPRACLLTPRVGAGAGGAPPWHRAMTSSAHGLSAWLACTTPASLSGHTRSSVRRRGAGSARRQAATVGGWRSASPA